MACDQRAATTRIMDENKIERWYTSDRFRSWAIGFLAVAFVAQAFPTLTRQNDYVWHMNQGKLFLAGTPIGLGTGIISGEWYPLSRSMFNVVPGWLPRMLGKGLLGLLAVACVAYSLRAFANMARDASPWDPRITFAASMFALVALAPYLNRDLDDAGLQCLMLGMLVLGGALLWQGRPWAAGFWLGTAVAYKFTPILFLPLLLWKRQGRAALALVLSTLLWNLAPAAFVGADKTVECHRLWWNRLAATRTRDIAENGIDPPNFLGQGLMNTCARYLQTYPPDHELYIDHPLFVQFGNFDKGTAWLLAHAAIATLGLGTAWGMRRPWSVRDPRLPYEWGVACIFAALIAPVCSRQHLVVAIPAAFLVWRSVLMAPKRSTLFWQAILLAVVVLAPQAELWGGDLTGVLIGYKIDTLALLGYAALLFRIAPVSTPVQQVTTPPVIPAPTVASHRQQAA
jgi:hypothetical protein